MPAEDRNRARTHADKRALFHQHGKPHGQSVLRKSEHGDQQDHFHKHPAAGLQEPQIRVKADGGKEKHHAHVLQGVRIDDLRDPRHIQDAAQDGENCPADHGHGDAELFQEGRSSLDKLSQIQRRYRNGHRLVHVQRDACHFLTALHSLRSFWKV